MNNLSLILAGKSHNGKIGIGYKNELPWKIKNDMKHFKNITTRQPGCNVVIMGRKTWESIGKKPLNNRINIVISRNPQKREHFLTLEECERFMIAHDDYNFFIIGGAEIYNHFLLRSTLVPKKIYITEIFSKNPVDCYVDYIPQKYIITKASEKYIEEDISYYFIEYDYIHNNVSQEYKALKLLRNIINNGKYKQDRTKTGTKSINGVKTVYDIENSIPLLTTKRVPWKIVLEELLWMIKGNTDVKMLQKKNIKIWDGNSSREFLDSRGLDYPAGVLGPCFTRGTLVWTENGLTEIENINVGYRVLTHTGEIMPVLETMKTPVNKNTIFIKITLCDKLNIITTSDHPFLVFPGVWKKANELSQDDKLILTISNPPVFSYIKIDRNRLNLLGLFITNGKLIKNNCIVFRIHLSKLDIFLKNFTYSKIVYSHKSIGGGYYSITVNDQKLIDYIKLFFVNPDDFKYRRLADSIFRTLTTQDMEFVLEGYFLFSRMYATSGCKTFGEETSHLSRYLELKRMYNIVYNNSNSSALEGIENVEVVDRVDEFVYNLNVKTFNSYTVGTSHVHNCYGFNYRHFGAEYKTEYANIDEYNGTSIGGIDQLKDCIENLKTDPFSRRHLITAWNPSVNHQVALPSCHFSYQFLVNEEMGKMYLSCVVYQRSQDTFLAENFNTIFYTMLTYIIALKVNMIPKEVIRLTGDGHIYRNHISQIETQLDRPIRASPILRLNPEVKTKEIEELNTDDFEIIGYFPDKHIQATMAI